MNNPNDNIERFNRFVIQLLADLYSRFPVAQDSMVEDYDYLNSAEYSSVFFSSMKFLKRENFVAYNDQIYGGFLGVSLTKNGFGLLSATPSALSKSKNLFDQLTDTIKSGSAEAYNALAKEIFKQSVITIIKKITKE